VVVAAAAAEAVAVAVVVVVVRLFWLQNLLSLFHLQNSSHFKICKCN